MPKYGRKKEEPKAVNREEQSDKMVEDQ